MTDPEIDALALARELIRCPSVTPEDAGALDVLADTLRGLGFTCHDLRFEAPGTDPVRNLYARLGAGGPHFCFAGHTDVVPVGARDGWTVDPFAATVVEDRLYGRGAADMKGAIAAFAAATARFLAARGADFGGSISFLITGDEEGPAVNGTTRMLDWLVARGETIDHCLVGEPTNPKALGDMIKIGRRGSLSGRLVVNGVGGHVAYPQLADNPIPRLVAMLAAITDHTFDRGTDHFQATNLEVTTVDVGNTAGNVIPGEAVACFNIRFNDLHRPADLEHWLRQTLDEVGGAYALDVALSGDAFLTAPGRFTDLVAGAVEKVTGRRPELSTSGGTSDARFIKNVCPVCEFGLVGQTMHKADENIDLAALAQLTDIYAAVLDGYFPSGV